MNRIANLLILFLQFSATNNIKQLAVMQNQRFFIEHSFRVSKHELGMDQFQKRKWNAWYHQIALIILSLFLILKEKITCFFKWPLLSAKDIRQIAGKQWEELKTFGDILIQLNQKHLKRQLDINRYQLIT
jgi:hypothetical protein